jgi:gamma-butyrobetaine dioxygenase
MQWHMDHYLEEKIWTRVSIIPDLFSESNLFIPYKNVLKVSGLVDAITQLSRYGLLFISGVPNQETSNEACELRTLAEQFGEIRTTFYGPLWDVVNGNNGGRNIAYTNLELGLHMDLLYISFFLFFFFFFLSVVLTIDFFTIDTSNIHLDTKYFIASEIKL